MGRATGRIPDRLPNGQNAQVKLAGERFGKLEVIEQADGRCPHGYTLWKARCSCGTEIIRPSYRFLRSPSIMSCRKCAPIGRPRIAEQGSHVNALFSSRKRAALERGLSWDLTKTEMLALSKADCHYCGAKPMSRYTHKNLSGDFLCNGIDRVDNDHGYIAGNVVTCCWTCNRAKKEMPYAQFVAWLDQIASFRRPRTRIRLLDRSQMSLLG